MKAKTKTIANRQKVRINKVRINIDLRRDGVPVEESAEANHRRLVNTLRDFVEHLASDQSDCWYSVAGGGMDIHGVRVRYMNSHEYY